MTTEPDIGRLAIDVAEAIAGGASTIDEIVDALEVAALDDGRRPPRREDVALAVKMIDVLTDDVFRNLCDVAAERLLRRGATAAEPVEKPGRVGAKPGSA